MDCMANTWNAAGIKKLDGRRESEQIKSDMQVGFTRKKSPWHVHPRSHPSITLLRPKAVHRTTPPPLRPLSHTTPTHNPNQPATQLSRPLTCRAHTPDTITATPPLGKKCAPCRRRTTYRSTRCTATCFTWMTATESFYCCRNYVVSAVVIDCVVVA